MVISRLGAGQNYQNIYRPIGAARVAEEKERSIPEIGKMTWKYNKFIDMLKMYSCSSPEIKIIKFMAAPMYRAIQTLWRIIHFFPRSGRGTREV